MKPVDQAIVHSINGDCWSACFASILEIELEEVPKFVWHYWDNPDEAVSVWLKQYGYQYARLTRYIKSEEEHYFWHATGFNLWQFCGVYCILTGKSPNIPGCYHAVVGYINHVGEIEVVHDPSPHKKGILGAPFYLSLFVVKNPNELMKKRFVHPNEIEYQI